MSQVKLDSNQLNALLRSPQGPVAQDLLRRGQRVQNRAKDNLRGAGGADLKAFDTGALTNSIATEFLLINNLPTVRVGANTYYALWIHEGTKKGMRARPYLREALSAAR
jgi:hypothetical protein